MNGQSSLNDKEEGACECVCVRERERDNLPRRLKLLIGIKMLKDKRGLKARYFTFQTFPFKKTSSY